VISSPTFNPTPEDVYNSTSCEQISQKSSSEKLLWFLWVEQKVAVTRNTVVNWSAIKTGVNCGFSLSTRHRIADMAVKGHGGQRKMSNRWTGRSR